MSSASDFVIENGVLKKYIGPGGEVSIPEGVTSIEGFAFERCSSITNVVIPASVASIGAYAFSECVELTGVTLLGSPDEYGDSCFRGCLKLADQNGLIIVGDRVFGYCGENSSVVVPEGVTEIASSAFLCSSITSIALPHSLRSIGGSAFAWSRNLEEITAYSKIVKILKDSFDGVTTIKKVSGDVLRRKEKIPAAFQVFYMGEASDTAYLTVFQDGKNWQDAVRTETEKNAEIISPALDQMIILLKEGTEPDKKAERRAAVFAQEFCRYASPSSLSKLLCLLKERKNPIVKKLEADEVFMQSLQDTAVEPTDELHPVEASVVRNLQKSAIYESVLQKIPKGVRYTDSETVCAPRVAAFVVSEYVKQFAFSNGLCAEADYSPKADEVADALNYADFIELLKRLADENEGAYLLPYARYSNEKHTTALISQIKKWEQWSDYGITGKVNASAAQAGLLLNNTRSALMYFEKYVMLFERYAKLRGTDENTLRDTVLADFGLDDNGQKAYDLGLGTVTVTLAPDLSLSIYNNKAGKTVKSIPKKNSDPEKYEAAKADFAELKKNVKKVAQNRSDRLFEAFLSTREFKAEEWKAVNLKNPVLNAVGRLIVWSQGENSFTLSASGPVCGDGKPYDIGDKPIRVAHTMEMTAEETAAWQNYFLTRGLKQPFQQIWEPAHAPEEIKQDRYAGCMIPYYRFLRQEKHGITVVDNDFHNDIEIALGGCSAEIERIDWQRHEINMDDRFEIKRFGFKEYTRQVNHIVAYLDRVTVWDRVRKDDTSVMDLMPGFTLAQITEFIAAAQEANAVNVLAALLEYKNANFADFDPMDEFTLEW